MTQPGLGFLIHDVARLLREDFSLRARALKLTQARWRALVLLAKMEGCTQIALARALNIQPITLGRAIDRLEADGLVERRADPRDRRAVALHLTAHSRGIVSKLFALGRGTQERALRGLDAREREQLFALLDRVKRNLSDPAPAGRRGRQAAEISSTTSGSGRSGVAASTNTAQSSSAIRSAISTSSCCAVSNATPGGGSARKAATTAHPAPSSLRSGLP
ncbi:MAG: winged helix-turn-helix transcriptional regulator [Verrucomicrobiae bacterium]|nr:winged helix-turn-helix transcriptional regulator [Verrucomicrobiae bacterium]